MACTTPVHIQVFDTSMNLSYILREYEYFRWEHNWYTPDTFELQVNRNLKDASGNILDSPFEKGGFIRYNRCNTAATERIGIIENIELPLGEEGKLSERWKITGRGVESILGRRRALNLYNEGDGYDTSNNTPAETALRWYVNKNCIDASNNARNITGLSLAAIDSGRGGLINYRARGQRITELLEEICNLSALSYGLVWSGTRGDRSFVFTVYNGTDRSTTVTLSPEFGNIREFDYQSSIEDYLSVVYVFGTGTGASRNVEIVYSGASEPAGWNRYEEMEDASDLDTSDLLIDRGNTILAEHGEEDSLDAVFKESNAFAYESDFFVGDIVTVAYPDVVTSVARIVGSIEEYDSTGEKISLVLGKEKPDLVSVIKSLKKDYRAQTRQ